MTVYVLEAESPAPAPVPVYATVEQAFPALDGRRTTTDVRFLCPACGDVNGGRVYLDGQAEVPTVVCGHCWHAHELAGVTLVDERNEPLGA